MKRAISAVVSLLTILSILACCIPAFAYIDDYYDYYYNEYYFYDSNGDGEDDTQLKIKLNFDDNTADIYDIYSDLEKIIIPESIKMSYEYYKEDTWEYIEKTASFTITSISEGEDEFAYNTYNLKEIEIPYTVKYIADRVIGYEYAWDFDPDFYDWIYELIPIAGFKIYCTKGTAGEQYALNNSFDYYAYNNMNSAVVSLSKTAYNYTGSGIKPIATVKYNSKTLTLNKDYTVSYKNNINCGTATVTITGIGNYRGIKTATFKINAISAANAKVSAIPNQSYTGKGVKPALTIKLNNKKLTLNKDYKVAYSSNIKLGTAKAKITFCGNYKGTKTVSFKIVVGKISNLKVASTSATSIKLTWSKVTCNYYYVYKYNTKTKKYALYKKITTNSFTDTKLTQFTKYSYKVKAVVNSNGKLVSGSLSAISGTTKLTTPTLRLETKNKAVTIKWSKNTKATGYQIYRSVNGGAYKKLKTITGSKTISYNNTKLSNSTYYYYKVRTYRTVNGKTYYSNFSTIRCSKDALSILNGSSLKSKRSFKVYNKQKSKTTSYTVKLSDKDIKTLKNFANKHFKKGWDREQRLQYTLNWINKNVKYARNADWNKICNKSWVDAIFNYKKGQCAQYNGAMAAMMVYLGYDAYVIQGYRGTYKGNHWQHFWCEVNINGTKYIMETGNYGEDGDWMYFLTPYSETRGYILNCKDVGYR